MKQCTCYALRAIDCTCKPAKYGELYTSPTAKQEQDEPVGKFAKFTDGIWREVADGSAGVPLYTTPQQRTWVGLTDEEIVSTSKETHFASKPVTAFAKAVEAKLKEKNA